MFLGCGWRRWPPDVEDSYECVEYAVTELAKCGPPA